MKAKSGKVLRREMPSERKWNSSKNAKKRQLKTNKCQRIKSNSANNSTKDRYQGIQNLTKKKSDQKLTQ